MHNNKRPLDITILEFMLHGNTKKENFMNYPSSSKKKTDWDKLEHELEKEEKDEKLDGDAGLQKFFKQIYSNGTEEQRRAMIKSFQTSGGTVLSTNWSDVASKDYEGKDRPDAPNGMEFRKYT